LVKNWDPFTNTSQSVVGARPSNGGHELSLVAIVGDGVTESVIVGADRMTIAAYRTPSSYCPVTRASLVNGGHWVGAQHITEGGIASTYVFQSAGQGPADALVTPLFSSSQRQVGGDDIFAIESYGAGRVDIFDRTSNQTFTTPFTSGSVGSPRVNASSVFFSRYEGIDQASAWVWERSSGSFHELIAPPETVVATILGDETTMVWLEGPPVTDGAFPPGVLYTSPFTTDPKQIVRTPRWSNLRVSPGGAAAAMGGGYYVVGDDDLNIRILRLADGRRWTLPTPRDDFSSGIRTMPYIDDKYIFLSTETEIFRIDMTAIGPGEAAE